MSDSDLKFPEWQIPVQQLILEFDPQKLKSKCEEVERLLRERLRHVNSGGDGDEERIALNYAVSLVRMIARERLTKD